MSKYRYLIPDYEGNYTEADNLSLQDFHRIDLYSGHSLRDVFPKVTLVITSSAAPADYFRVGSLHVVSERLKAVLMLQGAKAEFFQVDLTYEGKRHPTGAYFAMIVLDVVHCLDEARSKVALFSSAAGGGIQSVDRLVLDESKLVGKRLFVVEEIALVCMEEELAASIERANVTGLVLRDISEFMM